MKLKDWSMSFYLKKEKDVLDLQKNLMISQSFLSFKKHGFQLLKAEGEFNLIPCLALREQV